MKRFLVFAFFLCTISMFGQVRKKNQNVGGQFSLGIRSTMSLFSDAGSSIGTGAGGQVRIRLYNYLGTEWFGDYLTSSIGKIGTRTDYHIGWSVVFYSPKKKKYKSLRPIPYLLVGHCFDYTRVQGNNPFYQSATSSASRWSSAIQGGLGMHIPFTEKIDFSVSAQYMLHLGKDLTVETLYSGGATRDPFLYVTKEDAGLDGHLLISFSLNMRLADLWQDKKGTLAGKPVDPDGQNPDYIQQ
jgi:hypothetical protein